MIQNQQDNKRKSIILDSKVKYIQPHEEIRLQVADMLKLEPSLIYKVHKQYQHILKKRGISDCMNITLNLDEAGKILKKAFRLSEY